MNGHSRQTTLGRLGRVDPRTFGILPRPRVRRRVVRHPGVCAGARLAFDTFSWFFNILCSVQCASNYTVGLQVGCRVDPKSQWTRRDETEASALGDRGRYASGVSRRAPYGNFADCVPGPDHGRAVDRVRACSEGSTVYCTSQRFPRNTPARYAWGRHAPQADSPPRTADPISRDRARTPATLARPVAGARRAPMTDVLLGGPSDDRRSVPRLLPGKATIPERAAGHLHRAALLDRAMPTGRRLTVLKAPGGFGKTTLLAESCRRLRDDGVPVAWITVDGQDEPDVLDTCIAHACRNAVADALPTSGSNPKPSPADPTDGRRTALALREIAGLDGPFVIAFDELERLPGPDSVALIDFLLRNAPPNLNLALACRELPAGLDVAGALLEGRGTMLRADDLRFSRGEVAEFFGRGLSRARLDALVAESRGWPFALRICRNETEGDDPWSAQAAREVAGNWIESRLLPGLGTDNRAFLLDVSLFEWMDAALLDDVLERTDSLRWIGAMPALAGLLEPIRDGAAEIWRLHPLIREHCAVQLYREAPARYRTVHRRLSYALARRGETAAAMRHAVEAGSPELAGDILERAGGVGLWLREGTVRFQAAARSLRDSEVRSRPRLALVRCLALVLAGKLEEARRTFRALSASLGDTGDESRDDPPELAVAHCLVRGMIALHGSEDFGSDNVRTLLADLARLAGSPSLDDLARGYLEHSLCIAKSMTAQFGDALGHAARARRYFDANPYMTMLTDVVVGQTAMARGRVREAAAQYRQAEREARRSYVLDPLPTVMCDVLLQELALECDGDAALTAVPAALAAGRGPFQSHVAACGTLIELTRRDVGTGAALAAAAELLAGAREARLPAIAKYLSAQRVDLLLIAQRIDEAEAAWVSDDLPETPVECLDLAGQTWREMEALSCAQLRLMIARGRFESARTFARELRAVSKAQELMRTLMRTLALSIMLERRAGDAPAAAGHLQEYLRLYAGTPYAGPLARESADCAPVLAAFLESPAPAAADRELAQSLTTAMEHAVRPRQLRLSDRELQVLQRLDREMDKQIAAALGLSAHGVRYHLRNLFAKLGAGTRAEAVRRARELGLLHRDF